MIHPNITGRKSRPLLQAILTLALFTSMSPVATAATITVDGTTCTLADAITAANNDAASGGCMAGSGTDRIELQTDVTLLAALPVITGDLFLAGNGHTISGNGSTNATSGGGISSICTNTSGSAQLTLSQSTVSNNTAELGGGVALNLDSYNLLGHSGLSKYWKT